MKHWEALLIGTLLAFALACAVYTTSLVGQ